MPAPNVYRCLEKMTRFQSAHKGNMNIEIVFQRGQYVRAIKHDDVTAAGRRRRSRRRRRRLHLSPCLTTASRNKRTTQSARDPSVLNYSLEYTSKTTTICFAESFANKVATVTGLQSTTLYKV